MNDKCKICGAPKSKRYEYLLICKACWIKHDKPGERRVREIIGETNPRKERDRRIKFPKSKNDPW